MIKLDNKDNNNFGKEYQQPVLTPEEIRLIKQRRQEKLNELNQNIDSEKIKSGEPPRKPFKVNIPTHDLYSDNSPVNNINNNFDNGNYRNNYINRNYPQPPHQNDVPIYNNYNNVPQERYDHNKYLAQQKRLNNDTPPQKPKKKKKGHGFLIVLLCFFMILVLLVAGSFGYVYSLAKKVNNEELEENITHDLARSDDIKNILLIGLDKESDGISRSDTMMLLSIDKKSKTLKLTSFLRDTWVDIPDYYSTKLNASYAFGGPQLTVDTIESNFKIDIDHFVLVNFEMFEKIIDSLGGVTVDITEREAEFLTKNTRVKVSAGKNKLSGEEALVYSRIRKLDSDFYRTSRQRKVISSIIEKAKKTNPLTLVSMLSEIMPLITTDIEAFELTQLAFSALKYINYEIEQLQVPADDAYSSQMISGQSALVPDMDKNIDNIYEFIYG